MTETEGDQRGHKGLIRVAVAGATGFAGQELIRLLARHPHVTITAATGSQATSTPRRLPSLAKIWDGTVVPLERRGRSRPMPCFSRCRKPRPPSWRRRCSRSGLRVIDLSGAFRLRDDATRAKLYPATASMPAGVAYGLTEFELDAITPARLLSNPGCYPTASLLGLLPLQRAGLLKPGADIIIDAKSGISGAGKAATDRTHFSENHGSVAAYNPFGHRHTPEMEQALGQAVTFVPHLVPLDRGILVEHLCAPRAGHDRGRGERGVRARLCRCAVRAADRRRAARDQARRAHQLLRHRLEGRRGDGPRVRRQRDRQPGEGRGRARRSRTST